MIWSGNLPQETRPQQGTGFFTSPLGGQHKVHVKIKACSAFLGLNMANSSIESSTHWQKFLWLGGGAGLMLTITVLLAFVGVVLWRTISIIENQSGADLAFVFSSIGVITLNLLRLLAVLIGAAICFAGLAVSFYVHERATKLGAEVTAAQTSAANATLATYSPGIVGVIVGAIIIIFSLFSKSEHHYTGGGTYTLSVKDLATQPEDKSGKSNPGGASLAPLEELLGDPASPPNN